MRLEAMDDSPLSDWAKRKVSRNESEEENMKKKRVRVVAGVVLVCLLAGMLGVYSASGCAGLGLTYRLGNWGGLRFKTRTSFEAELLFRYAQWADRDSKDTYLSFQPAVLYHFEGSSATSPYVGIGYFSYDNTWDTGFLRESGPSIMGGIQYSLNENASIDLRVTAAFNSWSEKYSAMTAQGTYSSLRVDMGFTASLPKNKK